MNKPLADRIRPKTIDDIVGQKHLIAPDRPLRKIIESGDIPNLLRGLERLRLPHILPKRQTVPSKSLTAQRLQPPT